MTASSPSFGSKLTSRVSQRIGLLRLVKSAIVDTSVLLHCYCAFVLPIFEYCSLVWCGDLLPNFIFIFSCTRCIQWPDVVLIRVYCRCVIYVMLPHCVYCARLIRTRIIICSVSFHLLQSGFDILELRLQLMHYSLKYQGEERPNLQGVS